MTRAKRPPAGLTLIETLVALALLSIMAVIGIRVVQDTTRRAHDIQHVSVAQRPDLVVVQLLRQDFDRLARLPAPRRELAFSPSMSSLGLPDATWRWGGDGLRRVDHRTGIEIVLRSRPTNLAFELLRGVPAPTFTAAAKPPGEPLFYTITITLENAGSKDPALELVLPATRRLL